MRLQEGGVVPSSFGRKNSTLVDDKKWELFYQITEAYVRSSGTLPKQSTTFEGVGIGQWFAYQTMLSNIGLIPATRKLRLDQLSILVAELNPVSIESLVSIPPQPEKPRGRRTPMVRDVPVPETRRRRPETYRPRSKSAPKYKPAPKPVPLPKPGPELSPGVQASEPKPLPELSPGVRVVEPAPKPLPELIPGVRVTQPAPIPVVPGPTAPETTPEVAQEVAQEVTPTPDYKEVVVSDEAVEAADRQFADRVAAVTAFWNEHGRFPNRKEKEIRAGGASLTYWVWGLAPLLAKGELPTKWHETLFAAPWWPAIEKRADKLRVTDDGDKETPGETVSTPPSIDKDKHRKTYTQDMHSKERNPLAVKSREDKEAAEALAETGLSVKRLPEIGIVAITHDGVVGIGERFFKVGIYRQFTNFKDGADALAYLVESDIPRRAINLTRSGSGAKLEAEIRVAKLRSALERLADLGYTARSVGEW